jgi:hypothetical protein
MTYLDNTDLMAAKAMAERGIEPIAAELSIIQVRENSQRNSIIAKRFHAARKRGEMDETPTAVVCVVENDPWGLVELPADLQWHEKTPSGPVVHRFKIEEEQVVGGASVLVVRENFRALKHRERCTLPRWCAELMEQRGQVVIIEPAAVADQPKGQKRNG